MWAWCGLGSAINALTVSAVLGRGELSTSGLFYSSHDISAFDIGDEWDILRCRLVEEGMPQEIRDGQIWREVDPRFERYVRIMRVGKFARRSIEIRTVKIVDGQWQIAPHSRLTFCDLERFNGKRGGYELYEDVGYRNSGGKHEGD